MPRRPRIVRFPVPAIEPTAKRGSKRTVARIAHFPVPAAPVRPNPHSSDAVERYQDAILADIEWMAIERPVALEFMARISGNFVKRLRERRSR